MATYLQTLRKYGLRGTLERLYTFRQLKHGTLVGTDKFGNKYYENLEYEYGQHRWYEPPVFESQQLQEPSSVPPEWHGWLHCTTDAVPKTSSDPTGKWTGPAIVSQSDAHVESGHWVPRESREKPDWRPNPSLKRERGFQVDSYYAKPGENHFYTQAGHAMNPFHVKHTRGTSAWEPSAEASAAAAASPAGPSSKGKGAALTKAEKFAEARRIKTLNEQQQQQSAPTASVAAKKQ